MTDTQAVHALPVIQTEPCGDLCIRTLAMPADTNQNGDIFGGWLLSQMDIGGGVFASKLAKSRAVTVAIEAMNFRKPVYVGDLVSVHANLVKIGKTSITVHLEAWVLRRKEMQPILVTDGKFTYVAIDEEGHPQAVQRD
jgi:acyl-CoA thioesterase YciA